MPESEAHKILKKMAGRELKKAGFKEIREEYPIDIKGQRYIIDVVGINGEEIVAYECGTVNSEKLAILQVFFDKVVWTPYLFKRFNSKKRNRGKRNEWDIKLNYKGYGSIPKKLRDSWGYRLSIIPKACAGVIFGKDTNLRDVERSLEILLDDVKHRRERKEREGKEEAKSD